MREAGWFLRQGVFNDPSYWYGVLLLYKNIKKSAPLPALAPVAGHFYIPPVYA